MKKALLMFLIGGFILSSCNAQTAQDKKQKETTKTEKKMKTIHLNKMDFLTKVVNYEANPGE